MIFTIVNVLHKKPTDDDYWQLHKHNCDDALQSKTDGYDIHELDALDVAAAQKAWIDGELEDLGYQPRDVHIMPCCEC